MIVRTVSWMLLLSLVVVTSKTLAALPVVVSPDGLLTYVQDKSGNQIPDFSRCGYAGADQDTPGIAPRILVKPAEGDDGPAIQAALDYVAGLPLDEHGFRGAVRLAPGEFQVAGQLVMRTSGVVLQGSGATDKGTTLTATGTDRRELIRVLGSGERELVGSGQVEGPSPSPSPEYRGGGRKIAAEIVPVGATQLPVDSVAGLAVGDTVVVTRPSTVEWIKSIGCDAFGVGWRPGSRDIRWERIITGIADNVITLDAPVTTALEQRFGGGTVQKCGWPGRISRVGIEDLQLVSQVKSDNPLDEDHAWLGITLDKVENAWVRRVTFRHFAGGAVHLLAGSKWVTIADCISTEPVSELGGYRRHTFFTQGQLVLFLRCWSEEGRHDFGVGHCAPGPNAFVNCIAMRAHGESGPLESWASGVLFDNVRIDGGGLHLVNRWSNPGGCGWSAANCVLWQCRAATVDCFRPPGANNWCLGNWAVFSGDGTFAAQSDFVSPMSLYQGQLAQRLGPAAAERIEPILGHPRAATNPTYEEAAAFAAQSRGPARQLVDVIRENLAKGTVARLAEDLTQVPSAGAVLDASEAATAPVSSHPLALKNGWLVVDGQVKTGDYLDPTWWRGTMRPDEAAAMGPNISRFMPGRWGTGLTDQLADVATMMVDQHIAAYEHHYGLWYEHRRDDHLMERRDDGQVIPPFYEQPFARTGRGTAWDGLSKYDLTKFNPWYWNRLRDFAGLCQQHGLVLMHQNFFQHNILEAGAHWVDCPWRPANNVNDMGILEPPVFIGDKRQFMAPSFYDLSYPPRRELFRNYIRHCLVAFADSPNVIQLTSAEYTGPLEFMEFWLDIVGQWQQETGRDVLVGLSCTKDVQDAILADRERCKLVDVIDIRYWTYDKNLKLYAPAGGANLAPRQHLRQLQPEESSFASIVKAVRETRLAHPEKAVLYNPGENCRSGRDGWAVLIGGGSLANMRIPADWASAITAMQPADNVVAGGSVWCLASTSGSYVIYSLKEAPFSANLPDDQRTYSASWLDPQTGKIVKSEEIRGGRQTLQPHAPAVLIVPANHQR